MYLQEFLTLPSEDGQSASGPGNYSEGNKRYSWDTNRFIKTSAVPWDRKNLVFVLPQGFEQNCWSSCPQPSHCNGRLHAAVRKSHLLTQISCKHEEESSENLKSAIKFRTTVRYSCNFQQ